MTHRLLLGAGVLVCLLTTLAPAQRVDLLGSTATGELVAFDLTAMTIDLVGTAPMPGGWSDLAMSPDGRLLATSRNPVEVVTTCFGQYSQGVCAHLYELDPLTGMVLGEVGDMGVAYVGDLVFTRDGFLYGNRYPDTQTAEDGGLVFIDPITAAAMPAPNLRFAASPTTTAPASSGRARATTRPSRPSSGSTRPPAWPTRRRSPSATWAPRPPEASTRSSSCRMAASSSFAGTPAPPRSTRSSPFPTQFRDWRRRCR
jgi:hypothetical protein